MKFEEAMESMKPFRIVKAERQGTDEDNYYKNTKKGIRRFWEDGKHISPSPKLIERLKKKELELVK